MARLRASRCNDWCEFDTSTLENLVGRRFASVLGPLALAVALVRGIRYGAGAESTFLAATMSLLAFSAVGYVAGQLGQWIVEESVRARVDAELKKQRSQ